MVVKKMKKQYDMSVILPWTKDFQQWFCFFPRHWIKEIGLKGQTTSSWKKGSIMPIAYWNAESTIQLGIKQKETIELPGPRTLYQTTQLKQKQ